MKNEIGLTVYPVSHPAMFALYLRLQKILNPTVAYSADELEMARAVIRQNKDNAQEMMDWLESYNIVF